MRSGGVFGCVAVDEAVAGVDPCGHFAQQLVDCLTPLVPGQVLVQAPPDPLDRVFPWRLRGPRVGGVALPRLAEPRGLSGGGCDPVAGGQVWAGEKKGIDADPPDGPGSAQATLAAGVGSGDTGRQGAGTRRSHRPLPRGCDSPSPGPCRLSGGSEALVRPDGPDLLGLVDRFASYRNKTVYRLTRLAI